MRAVACWILLGLGLALPAQAQDEHGGGDREENARIHVPEQVIVSPAVSVGTHITITFTEASHSHPYRTVYAFVGETEEAWLLEYVDPSLGELRHVNPLLHDVTLALVVRKRDGRVLRAWSGHPGDATLSEHPVAPEEPASRPTSQPASRPASQPASRPTSQPAAPPTEEATRELKVAAGTFRARESLQGGMRFWIGTEGPTRGALIKAQTSELLEVGDLEDLVLGEVTVQAHRLDYTDKSVTWVTDDPLVSTYVPLGSSGRGVARVRGPGFETRVESIGADATPTLTWPADVLGR